jgi:hypothetical protein
MQRQEKDIELPSSYRNMLAVMSSAAAAITELAIFQPGDTVSKRLQNSKLKLYVPGQMPWDAVSTLKKVIFSDAYDKSFSKKISSLYSGLSFAALYKMTQVIIRFSGQPLIRDYLEKNHKTSYQHHIGDKYAMTMLEATAGAMIGVVEGVLVPADNLKIKYQNNHAHFRNIGFFQAIRSEGVNLFNGMLVTLMRNIPASFILFGSSRWAKQHVLGVENPGHATIGQNILASSLAASSVVISTHPIDTIKTRVQSRQGHVSTLAVVKDLVAKEGYTAFFKGVLPKLAIIAPKITVTMTLAQSLPYYFAKLFKPRPLATQGREEAREVRALTSK